MSGDNRPSRDYNRIKSSKSIISPICRRNFLLTFIGSSRQLLEQLYAFCAPEKLAGRLSGQRSKSACIELKIRYLVQNNLNPPSNTPRKSRPCQPPFAEKSYLKFIKPLPYSLFNLRIFPDGFSYPQTRLSARNNQQKDTVMVLAAIAGYRTPCPASVATGPEGSIIFSGKKDQQKVYVASSLTGK